MIARPLYLDKLIRLQGKHLIKIITGIRRSGKSTLFEIFKTQLITQGIASEQIQSINFEDADHEELLDWQKLHTHIKDHLIPNKMNYIFLDEIQNVKQFEKVADSLFIKKNVDLYLTGSNATLLSGEIATLLSGRYIEIQVLPLSFKEYLSAFKDRSDVAKKFRTYLTQSSFPYTIELENDSALIRDYLGGIFNTVVLKDIVSRKKIADAFMLENVIRFMFDNIGNFTSVKKISDTLTSQGTKISTHTVASYVQGLVDSYILHQVSRYNIKGKQHLRQGGKYYLADIGLRYYLLGSKRGDAGHVLENIVYLELIRRGYEVSVGCNGPYEVDFVAMNEKGIEYFQIAHTVREEETLERELRALRSISDHYPKYLLTMDEDPDVSHDGIRQRNALDWLLAS